MSGRYYDLDIEQKKILKQFYVQYYNYIDQLPSSDASPKIDSPILKEASAEKNKSGFSSLRSKLPKMMQKSSSEDTSKEINSGILSKESFRRVVIGQTQFDHPDSVTLRYIRARKWNTKDALNMFTTAIQWFHSVDIIKIKKEGEQAINMDLFKKNQFYMQGVDNEGRPVCHVVARLHDPKALTMEELQGFVLNVMESARLLIVEPADTVTIVFDLSDMSMANMDYSSVKFLISCLEKYYPESLGRIIALNAPWFFSSIWKVLSPLIDPVVAAKIKFINTKELSEYISPTQLRKDKNGTGELDYKYIDPSSDENKIMEDNQGYQIAYDNLLKAWDKFEELNRKWAQQEDDSEELDKERNELIDAVRQAYVEVDPYIRARTIYHRIGVVKGYNQVDWDAVKVRN